MSNKKIPIWLWGVSAGLLLLCLGIWTGQYEDIYRKAILICLECIGIG